MAENTLETEARLKFTNIERELQKLDKVEQKVDRILAKAKSFRWGSMGGGSLGGGSLGGPSSGGGRRGPRKPKPGDLTLFDRVLKDLSGDTLSKFSSATNLSTKTLAGLTSAAGMSASALTSVAAVLGPLVLLLGSVAAAATAMAVGYSYATTQAIEFQVASQSVAKTTDLVGASLKQMEDRLIDLSTNPQLGKTATELAGITAVAGTLGLRGAENLEIFTEAIARLNATSDVTGDLGTQQFGKFLAISRRAASEALSLSSAITLLAANRATTEAAILESAKEVQKGGSTFNLEAEDALALAATYEELGVQQEQARTATLRLGQTIQSAVLSGGEDLKKLADVAGVTSQQLEETFREDAGDAIVVFLEGLNRLKAEQRDVPKILDEIGLSGVRLQAVIPALADNVTKLEEAMAMAADESRNPSRIFMESANMADTTARRFENLQNKVDALAIGVGQELLPALDDIISTASSLVDTAQGLEGVLGPLGDAVLSKVSNEFQLMAKAIQLAADTFKFGLGNALLGAGDYVREAEKIAAFKRELEGINEAAKSGDLKEMMEVNAGLQSVIGESGAKVALYTNKLKALLQETNNGATATERQKKSIQNYTREILQAQKKTEKYTKAGKGLRAEIDRLTAQQREKEAADVMAAAAEEDARKKRGELRKETAKYQEELAKLGETLTESVMTPQEKAAKELAKYDELLAENKITQETWKRAVKASTDSLKEKDESAEALNRTLDDLSIAYEVREAILQFGVDATTAADAVNLAAAANIGLADALDLVREKQSAQVAIEVAEFEVSGGFLGAPSQEEIDRMTEGMELWDLGTTRIKAYLKEVDTYREKLDTKEITEEQYENAMASLEGQMEGWELLGAKIAEIAESTGGVWGQMLEGLSENLGKVSSALSSAAGIAFDRGDDTAGHALNFANAAVNRDASGMMMSGVAATGFGQQRISQFGGRGEGNFVQEGMEIGSAFGPWGTLIGGVVGAFVKKGADDFHSHMTEVAGQANLVITQAEGDLDKVGKQIKGTVDGMLNSIQEMIGADLDFALEGFEIHIRENRIRVVANGIEQVFEDMDQAIDFFVHGMIDAQGDLAGLGPNMQAAFDHISSTTTATGDPGRLMKALDLSSQMDFAETGVRQDLIAQRREDLQLLRDFGIPLTSYIELKKKEMETYKRSLISQAAGITDWASNIAALSKELTSVNNTIDATVAVDLARKAELEELLAAQEAHNASLVDSNTALDQNTLNLQQQTGMTDDQAAAHQAGRDAAMGATNAGYSYAESQQGVTNSYTGGTHAAQLYGQAMIDETKARNDGTLAARQYQAELDLINEGLEGLPEGFDAEEMQRAIDAQTANAAGQIASLILGFAERGLIDLDDAERLRLQEQIFELEKVSAIVQMHAVQMQIEAMIALGTMSAFVTGVMEDFLKNVPGWIEDIAGADFSASGRGRGRNRRRERQAEAERQAEEERRLEEENAAAVEEFNRNLETMELNLMSASGRLGDLTAIFSTIADEVERMREAGAAEEDLTRFQRLSFLEARGQINPFANEADTFDEQNAEIERARRGGLEDARAFAEAKGEALGLSRAQIESIYDQLAVEIEKGSKKAEKALVNMLVDALGLPLEQARKTSKDFKKSLRDLHQAFADGAISADRYQKLLDQVAKKQLSGFITGALGFAEKWGIDLENKAELQIQVKQMEYEVELAIMELKLHELEVAGLMSDAQLEAARELVETLKAADPNFGDDVSDPTIDSGGFGGSFGSRISSSSSSIGNGLAALLGSIESFINGFEAMDMGQFERMAHDYLTSIEGFHTGLQTELDTVLSTGYDMEAHAIKTARNFLRAQTGDWTLQLNSLEDLTDEQLQMLADADLSGIEGFKNGVGEVFDVLKALEEAEGLKPTAIKNIIAAYKGVEESQSALVREHDSILSQYEDVSAALVAMGASSAELAEIESIHLENLRKFNEEAVSGIRAAGDELKTGSMSGISEQERFDLAKARFDELKARAEAGDLEAVEELDVAMTELAEAGMALSGGFGPIFDLLKNTLIDFSESFEIPTDEAAAMVVSDPLLVAAAESQLETATLSLDTSTATLGVVTDSREYDRQVLDATLEGNHSFLAQSSAMVGSLDYVRASVFAVSDHQLGALEQIRATLTEDNGIQTATIDRLGTTMLDSSRSTSILTARLVEINEQQLWTQGRMLNSLERLESMMEVSEAKQ